MNLRFFIKYFGLADFTFYYFWFAHMTPRIRKFFLSGLPFFACIILYAVFRYLNPSSKVGKSEHFFNFYICVSSNYSRLFHEMLIL